jgi:hypothetical protein
MAKQKQTRGAKEVLADRQEAVEAYAALAQDPETKLGQLNEAAEKVKGLNQELSAVISEGAELCETCGNAPMGMLKTPAYFSGGLEVPAVYEVGCVYCAPYVVDHAERGVSLVIDGETRKVLRRSYSARSTDPAEAVRKWNDGEWVEDTLFDRIPGFTPQPA